MRLDLFDGWFITSIPRNIVLNRTQVMTSGKHKGQTKDVEIGYYPRIGMAFERILEKEIIASEAIDIDGLIKEHCDRLRELQAIFNTTDIFKMEDTK